MTALELFGEEFMDEPPRMVTGPLLTKWVEALKYTQYLVGGVLVDQDAVAPVRKHKDA